VNVRTYGDFKRTLGERFAVDLEKGATIRDLVSKIRKNMDATKRGFLNQYKFGSSTLTVLVNGRNINALSKLETELKDCDTVTIIPLVVGG